MTFYAICKMCGKTVPVSISLDDVDRRSTRDLDTLIIKQAATHSDECFKKTS